MSNLNPTEKKFENGNAKVTFRFIHLDAVEDGTDRDELAARYLPHSLYYSLVCGLLGSAKGCKNMFSNFSLIEGDRMFMLKLQHDEKEGKSIQLVIRLDRDGDGLAAGRDCINAVYQRVCPILDQLCERGHFGMFYWGEIQCKCGGNIPLDTQRCTRCKEMCMEVCSQWKIETAMETKPKLKTSSENPQDFNEGEIETKESSSFLNSPGSWDVFISHTQRNPEGKLLALDLYVTLREMGYSVWLDVKMNDKSMKAMEEGAKNARVVVAVITDSCVTAEDDPKKGGPEQNMYFNRWMCQQELKWAIEADVFIQPVIRMEDKKKIGHFIDMAPEEFKYLGGIDWKELNRSDSRFFKLGVEMILEGAKIKKAALKVEPTRPSGSPRNGPGSGRAGQNIKD